MLNKNGSKKRKLNEIKVGFGKEIFDARFAKSSSAFCVAKTRIGEQDQWHCVANIVFMKTRS
jgi:hypothetical protein